MQPVTIIPRKIKSGCKRNMKYKILIIRFSIFLATYWKSDIESGDFHYFFFSLLAIETLKEKNTSFSVRVEPFLMWWLPSHNRQPSEEAIARMRTQRVGGRAVGSWRSSRQIRPAAGARGKIALRHLLLQNCANTSCTLHKLRLISSASLSLEYVLDTCFRTSCLISAIYIYTHIILLHRTGRSSSQVLGRVWSPYCTVTACALHHMIITFLSRAC
jgi:hypothetical protein